MYTNVLDSKMRIFAFGTTAINLKRFSITRILFYRVRSKDRPQKLHLELFCRKIRKKNTYVTCREKMHRKCTVKNNSLAIYF